VPIVEACWVRYSRRRPEPSQNTNEPRQLSVASALLGCGAYSSSCSTPVAVKFSST
jgi:hypothetical protein